MRKDELAHKFFKNDKWPTLAHRYEAEKQNWVEEHPEATHTEYERAIREIAQRLGF